MTREEMLAAFGPFAVVFEPIRDDKTPYLSLLHLHAQRVAVVIDLIRAASRNDDSEPYILALLRDVNWRPHLVGAIASYFRKTDATVAQMWRAVDGGSWVTPQLSAVLSLIDDSFVDRALERLASHCPLWSASQYSIDSPIERHVAQGPAGSYHRSSKAASSFLALLRLDSRDDERVTALENDSELRQLVADDVDDGGGIATSWRARLLELAVQP
jgi:hypothetical protein